MGDGEPFLDDQQSLMRQREQRHPVLIPARVRWDGRWVAASIRNISSRGMMLRTGTPPPPGTYVEIQLNAGAITARSMWTFDQACGLRTQDRIDVNALKGTRGAAPDLKASAAVAEARSQIRRPVARSAQEVEARSQRLSSLFQFFTIVAVGLSAAGSVAWEAYQILSVPVARIQEHMQ